MSFPHDLFVARNKKDPTDYRIAQHWQLKNWIGYVERYGDEFEIESVEDLGWNAESSRYYYQCVEGVPFFESLSFVHVVVFVDDMGRNWLYKYSYRVRDFNTRKDFFKSKPAEPLMVLKKNGDLVRVNW